MADIPVDKIRPIIDQLQQLVADATAPPQSPLVIRVTPENIQATINAGLAPGTTLLLATGAVCGPIAIHGSTGVTIRTDVALPPLGTRITRADSDTFATIGGLVSGSAVTYQQAYDWILRGVTIAAHPDSNNGTVFSDEGSDELTLSQCLVRGDGQRGGKVGVQCSGGAVSVLDSLVTDFFRSGQDSQGIACARGIGRLTVDNCLVEAAGENILIGGDDPIVQDRVPSDILVTRSLLRKPTEWRGKGYNAKNLFELKNARNVHVIDNDMENCWGGEGQSGYAIVLTPRNQGGKAPWSTIEDVEFSRNRVRHVAAGFNLLGTDNLKPSGVMTNVRIAETDISDLDSKVWGSVDSVSGIGFQVDGVNGLVIDGLTLRGPNVRALLAFVNHVTTGFAFVNVNADEGKYGFFSTKGLGVLALNAYAPSANIQNVTLTRTTWPTGTKVTYPSGVTVQQ